MTTTRNEVEGGYGPEIGIRLDVLHKLGIEKREAHKFRLVQVHHEQLVRGSQVRLFRGELFVEITDVLTVLLKRTTNRSTYYSSREIKSRTNPGDVHPLARHYLQSLA